MKVQVLPIYSCLSKNSKLEAVCIPGLVDSIILTTWRELTLLSSLHVVNIIESTRPGIHRKQVILTYIYHSRPLIPDEI